MQTALDACKVVDHNYIGPVFTWSNSQVYCKLDRVLVNQEWLSMTQDSTVHFHPPGVSNHAFSITRVFKEQRVRGVPFRFKNIWSEDQDFLPIVTSIWRERVHGCFMFQLVTELKSLKYEFKKLNVRKYQNLEKQVA